MPAANTILPARRPDLVFRPVGDDGQHVVKDPRTGAYFKLGPQESFLFQHLDGRRGADEVCRAFSRRFGEPLAGEDLEQFLALAEQSAFFAAPPSPPKAQPAPAPPPAPSVKPRSKGPSA